MSAHTPGPWHVNGIDSKRGCITGDETSTGWDKLQVNGTNQTVATVYRPKDARLIAAAPRMRLLIEQLEAWARAPLHSEGAIQEFADIARAILNDV